MSDISMPIVRIVLVCAGVGSLAMSGCASTDNSMASSAVDIPDNPPLSAQSPVMSGTASVDAPKDTGR